MALVFTAVVLLIVFRPRPDVYTDDAYVTAHYATMAPRIAGQVAAVLVDDNQHVTAGQLLVQIDDRDYRVSLAEAEAQLERDRAQVEDVTGTIARQPAVIDQTKAQVGSTAAQLASLRPTNVAIETWPAPAPAPSRIGNRPIRRCSKPSPRWPATRRRRRRPGARYQSRRHSAGPRSRW